jgi:hypothetical protein
MLLVWNFIVLGRVYYSLRKGSTESAAVHSAGRVEQTRWKDWWYWWGIAITFSNAGLWLCHRFAVLIQWRVFSQYGKLIECFIGKNEISSLCELWLSHCVTIAASILFNHPLPRYISTFAFHHTGYQFTYFTSHWNCMSKDICKNMNQSLKLVTALLAFLLRCCLAIIQQPKMAFCYLPAITCYISNVNSGIIHVSVNWLMESSFLDVNLLLVNGYYTNKNVVLTTQRYWFWHNLLWFTSVI